MKSRKIWLVLATLAFTAPTASCGGDDNNGGSNNGGTNNGGANNGGSNNGGSNNGGANNGGSNNGDANNGVEATGSCYHNCVSDGPLGQIENFGCVAPSGTDTCQTDGQAHCDALGWGITAASEYVASCASCSESCAPDFYDCSAGACATDVN